MGFVSSLFFTFAPVILSMILFYQRDHIFSQEQNLFFDDQVNKLAVQFNYHLDSVKDQLDNYVKEQKKIVSNFEPDVDERITKKTAEQSEASQKQEHKSIDHTAKVSKKEQENNDKKQTTSQSSNKCDLGKDLLVSKEQLAKYDGQDASKKIYLAFLGIVYDVSKGEQHYAPGGAYSMFTGRDASRAFISGDFSEAGLTDDLSGLDAQSFSGVKEWADFYEKTYRRVGRLVGAFYDQNGCATQQIQMIEEQLAKVNVEQIDEQLDHELFPPCNTEWNNAKKETKFWCSKQSGGIQRDWVGVPRQLFNLKNKKDFRCACVRDFGPATGKAIQYADEDDETVQNAPKSKADNTGDLNDPRVREFEGCAANAVQCIVKDR